MRPPPSNADAIRKPFDAARFMVVRRPRSAGVFVESLSRGVP
jgi:hypothetical protein